MHGLRQATSLSHRGAKTRPGIQRFCLQLICDGRGLSLHLLRWLDRLKLAFWIARHPARIAHGCAGTSRWNSMIQFVSQVFPASPEKACCHLAELGAISDQI